MTDTATFFAAVREGSTERAQALLTVDPHLARARHGGATALHFAAVGNNRPMVDLLLVAGADPNARDETYQMTPIGWANEEGHEEMVHVLFSRGAAVDLHQAASYGLTDKVRELVKGSRRSVNAVVGGWTPLQLATLWGHFDVVEVLLGRGADPLVRDPYGRTTIEIARAQMTSNGKNTPVVREERRQRIVSSCARIAELLERRSPH